MLCLYYFKKKNRPHLKHKAEKKLKGNATAKTKRNLKGSNRP